jgi:hypothetical protein
MATTLRQQLMIARSLRQLRTWAPPISIGIIVGAGAFLAAERLDPPRAPQPAPVTYASPAPTRVVYVAQPEQAAQSLQIAGYANCDAARAVGAAPIYRDQPGYDIHLDGDRDGIACESYPR